MPCKAKSSCNDVEQQDGKFAVGWVSTRPNNLEIMKTMSSRTVRCAFEMGFRGSINSQIASKSMLKQQMPTQLLQAAGNQQVQRLGNR